MTVVLPYGEEAAERRRSTLASSVEGIGHQFGALCEAPAGYSTKITCALAQVREDPTDIRRWWALSGAVGAASIASVRANSPDAEGWQNLADSVKQATYYAERMCALRDANAPICDAHGPMADSADATIPADVDGRRWHCVADRACSAGYWWLDGRHQSRR